VTGRQGRRRRKLLDDLKERRGHSHLKKEALYPTMRMNTNITYRCADCMFSSAQSDVSNKVPT